LSVHESHERFQISAAERGAWLKHMRATLDSLPLDDTVKHALRQFFVQSSAYMVDKPTEPIEHGELAQRWDGQLALDETMREIAAGRDDEAIAKARQFADRPSVFVGLLTRMMQTRRDGLIDFVVDVLERDASITLHRFAGKTLLHYAAGAGCLEAVRLLLRLGMDPNVQDSGKHTPLYSVANECAIETGPEIVRALVDAGANVNWQGGAAQATPLHMAARRGHLSIAQALLDCGATADLKDRKGETPRQRAINCRKPSIVQLLAEPCVGYRRSSAVEIPAIRCPDRN
jgi:hypothetical protein